jgi:hypothetical protein
MRSLLIVTLRAAGAAGHAFDAAAGVRSGYCPGFPADAPDSEEHAQIPARPAESAVGVFGTPGRHCPNAAAYSRSSFHGPGCRPGAARLLRAGIVPGGGQGNESRTPGLTTRRAGFRLANMKTL